MTFVSKAPLVALAALLLLGGCSPMPRAEPIYIGPDGKPRAETAAEWQARQPAARETALRPGTARLQIGASRSEVQAHPEWGNPVRLNTTVTSSGTREQWVYRYGRYLYLENGRVVAMEY